MLIRSRKHPRPCPAKVFLIGLLFLSWALVLTWPLVFHLSTHIPLGDEPFATVPLFNLWTFQWNLDQLVRGYPNYWNAPIFAPHRGTFALSEPQLLTALLVAPVWLATQSPALAYNAVLLLFLTLNGWFGYQLLREWRGSACASIAGGLLVMSMPFISQELGVLQLTAVFGLLWQLLFLTRLCQRPTVAHSLGFGVGIAVTFLTCGYYGLFSLIFVPLYFLVYVWKSGRFWKSIEFVALAGLIAIIFAGPALWLQHQALVEYGFQRSVQTITNNSARLADYGKFLDRNLLYGWLLSLESAPGQRLFPGLLLFGLAQLGFWRGDDSVHLRKIQHYLFGSVLLAVILSLGYRLEIGGVHPYSWIRDYLPGFAQLRSPFRFAMVAHVYLALLAGLGLDWLWRRPVRLWFVATITLLVLVEMLALPTPLSPVPEPPRQTAWANWLATQSEAEAIAVRLPYAAGRDVEAFEQTVIWMLENRAETYHMVNGYSGYFPVGSNQLRKTLTEFPSPLGVQLLKDRHVEFIIADGTQIDLRPLDAQFEVAFDDPVANIRVYRLQEVLR